MKRPVALCIAWTFLTAGCLLAAETDRDAASPTPAVQCDFPIRVGDRTVMGTLAEPAAGGLAADPAVLLTFTSTRRDALGNPPQDEPAQRFLAAGHRVLSFDLPEHGDRVTAGREEGIGGMRQALLAGDDPFARFVADGRAAVDAVLAKRLASPGKIYVCGVSRAGYCALRLAAAEPRISAVAALAPVTDWRALREFTAVADRPDVAALRLENFAAALAGRPVYVAIGGRDDRVGTERCTGFALRVIEEEARRGLTKSQLCLHVVDDSQGHALDLRWRREGADYLLRLANHRSAATFSLPTLGVRPQPRALLLAIDDVALPLRRNLCYYLSKPAVRREPVLLPGRENPNSPDCLAAHFYGTVLFEQGRYRMWYYACHRGRNPDWPASLLKQADRWKDAAIPGPLCYAESIDGLHWTKPNLGQLLFKGDRKNNAFDLPSALTGDACVVRDDDDPDPRRRYKLAFWTQFDPYDYPTMRIATSADGLRWTTAPQPPIPAFLEHASFYRHNGLYIANSQTFLMGEGGRDRGRQGAAWVSADFDHWLAECAESFALPASSNVRRDEVHLGVGAASYGNVAVGLYCIWHNDADFGKISGDLGLVISHDGLHFHEPVKGHVYISTADSPVTPVADRKHPTVLCQANGILNVGNETRIYHGRWRNAGSAIPAGRLDDYFAEVALATLPRDRWGALGLIGGESDGSVWTAPVTLPKGGCRVSVNADGAAAVAVEAADERFALLKGFSGAHCGRIETAGGMDCPVAWPAADLRTLGGKTIRLRFHLKKTEAANPRLYAVYLNPPQPIAAGR